MNLTGIISISGQSGLYKIISQTKNGIIVEPLGGGRRFPVHGAQRVSSIEDISIYTYEEDTPLADVFKNIFKNLKGKEGISHKSDATELKAFLEQHLPNYDQERVYVSDIKKVAQWYNQLLASGLLEEKAEESKSEEKGKKKVAKPTDAKAKKVQKDIKPKKSTPKKAASSTPQKKGQSSK